MFKPSFFSFLKYIVPPYSRVVFNDLMFLQFFTSYISLLNGIEEVMGQNPFQRHHKFGHCDEAYSS